MRRHISTLVLAAMVVVLLLIGTVMYKVSFTEDALVLTFGAARQRDIVRGSEDAGLHFKWPWPIQKVVRYDGRTFVFEDTSSELPTRDKQNMLVTTYCAWRIEDPRKFYVAIERTNAAQERLRDLLRSAKKDVIGRYNMEAFVNTDPAKILLPQIEREILDAVSRPAEQDYGVQVVRVGIKSLGLPENVTSAVIDAMKEERQRDVRKYESAGEAQATAIRERARTASRQILEFAQRKAAAIRSEGVRRAAETYQGYRENEAFSMFLRYLESLEKELSARSVIILDASQIPALRWFKEGPSLPDVVPGPGEPRKE